MGHWTYVAHTLEQDLEQGDILRPSDALKEILEDVHPHFCNDKYTGFLVLTQSCDLVRRGAKVTAPYIQICVIRPFEQVRSKLFASIAAQIYDGAFLKSDRYLIRNAIGKLINQNDQSRGLFFLYRDRDRIGLVEDSVAFLRVSVALRAEHYQTVMESRTGKLRPDFRAKLGWLAGNLYDRPATPDWSEESGSKVTAALVEELLAEDEFKWIPQTIAEAAKVHKLDLKTARREEVEKITPKPPIEQLVEAAVKQILKMGEIWTEEMAANLKRRLLSDPTVRRCLKLAELEDSSPF